LLSGRDPSTFPSAISANFFYIDKISKLFIDKIRKLFIDKINKFCGCSSSQISSTDPDEIRHDIINKIFINNSIAPALQDSSGFSFSIGNQQLAQP
jgi:hypothetical protein